MDVELDVLVTVFLTPGRAGGEEALDAEDGSCSTGLAGLECAERKVSRKRSHEMFVAV